MSLYSIPSEDDIVYGKKQSDTVRSSQQTWVVMIPINVTLGVAGTADTMFDVDTNRHKATRNTLTNPSFETGSPPTGYTAVSSTLTRSAVTARTGTYSMKIVTGNSVEILVSNTSEELKPFKFGNGLENLSTRAARYSGELNVENLEPGLRVSWKVAL